MGEARAGRAAVLCRGRGQAMVEDRQWMCFSTVAVELMDGQTSCAGCARQTKHKGAGASERALARPILTIPVIRRVEIMVFVGYCSGGG